MRCEKCNKKIDDIDRDCGWCTYCGTHIDVAAYNAQKKSEN